MDNIRPSDINTNEHLFGAFGNMETEVSAGWIVEFLAVTGDTWRPFTLDELQRYYAEQRAPIIFEKAMWEYNKALAEKAKYPNRYVYIPAKPTPVSPNDVETFHFNRLTETLWDGTQNKYIPTGRYLREVNGTYEVTDLFIQCCFRATEKTER